MRPAQNSVVAAGGTFVASESMTLVGLVHQGDAASPSNVSLNGVTFCTLVNQTQPPVVFIPTKIPLRKGDRIGLDVGQISLFFA